MWPLASDECYVSVDIEADGPIPGVHSMLSVGAAALTSDGDVVDTFTVNIEPLPEASEDVRTMRWWAAHADAYAATQTDQRPPADAMGAFSGWLEDQHRSVGAPVMVAWPLAFDGMWMQWYLHRFTGESPFRRRAIDVRTLAMVSTGAGYARSGKPELGWKQHKRAAHTHVALDDALEQAALFIHIVRSLNVQRGEVSIPPGLDAFSRTRRRSDRKRRRR